MVAQGRCLVEEVEGWRVRGDLFPRVERRLRRIETGRSEEDSGGKQLRRVSILLTGPVSWRIWKDRAGQVLSEEGRAGQQQSHCEVSCLATELSIRVKMFQSPSQ